MTLRSFIWAPLSDFGEIIAEDARVLSPIPQPDFTAGPDISWPEYGFTAHGLRMVDGKLDSGTPRLWKLRNVSVQRMSLGTPRYHIVLRDGVCAEDAYHYGPWIGRIRGEVFDLAIKQNGTNNGVCAINLMDDEEIGATVEEPTVLLSGPFQDNYAHTIHEILSKWWCAEAWPRDAKLLWDGMERIQKEAAAALRPECSFVDMPANRTLYRELWVPSLAAPFCVSEFQTRLLKQEAYRVLPRMLGMGGEVDTVYISRRDAVRRRVLNEQALLEVLPQPHIVRTLSDYPVEKQIGMFRSTSTLILPHGAASVNLLWMPPGSRVIELQPSISVHPMYELMAKWAGHKYARIVCRSNDNHDMTAEPDDVLKALEALSPQAAAAE